MIYSAKNSNRLIFFSFFLFSCIQTFGLFFDTKFPNGILNVPVPEGKIDLKDTSLLVPGGILDLRSRTLDITGGSLTVAPGTFNTFGGTLNLLKARITLECDVFDIPGGTIDLNEGICKLQPGTLKIPNGELFVSEGKITLSGPCNSANVEHYKRFINLLETVKLNPEFLKKINAEDAIEYQEILSSLVQLPANVAATLIHPQWAIGAKHVLNCKNPAELMIIKRESGIFRTKEEYAPIIDKVFPHQSLDLALVRLIWPCKDKEPVTLFKGNYDKKMPCYVFSDALHNHSRAIVQPYDFPLFGACQIEGSLDTANIKMKMIDYPHIIVRTYGGDSSGPIFVRVDNVGDPFYDFQLIGINSGPSDTMMNVIYLGHKEVQSWIEKTIDENPPSEEF